MQVKTIALAVLSAAILLGCPKPVTFSVDIDLFGLVGFVEHGGEAFALLVEADYDPGAVELKPEWFPPGVPISENSKYPPHYAYTRVHRGTVVNGAVLDHDLLIPLKGYDVRLNVPGSGTLQSDLSLGADSAKVFKTRGEEHGKNAQNRERVDGNFLDADISKYLGQGRLASRVRISNGNLDLKTLPPRDTYSFKLSTEGQTCPALGDRIGLAEAAKWTIEDAKAATLVLRDSRGQELTLALEPGESSEVRLEILNQVGNAIADKHYTHDAHLDGFRWFYKLSAKQEADPGVCDFYPCGGNQGGSRCPPKVFSAS